MITPCPHCLIKIDYTGLTGDLDCPNCGGTFTLPYTRAPDEHQPFYIKDLDLTEGNTDGFEEFSLEGFETEEEPEPETEEEDGPLEDIMPDWDTIGTYVAPHPTSKKPTARANDDLLPLYIGGGVAAVLLAFLIMPALWYAARVLLWLVFTVIWVFFWGRFFLKNWFII